MLGAAAGDSRLAALSPRIDCMGDWTAQSVAHVLAPNLSVNHNATINSGFGAVRH